MPWGASVREEWETVFRSSGPWDRLTVPQLSLAPESQGLIQEQGGGCREGAAGRWLAEPRVGIIFLLKLRFLHSGIVRPRQPVGSEAAGRSLSKDGQKPLLSPETERQGKKTRRGAQLGP